MYFIMLAGKRNNEASIIINGLANDWVTFYDNPLYLVNALSALNRHNPKSYNLVVIDPYVEKRHERAKFIWNVLELNEHKRATAIIKDVHIESIISVYRPTFNFYELKKETDIAKEIIRIISLN